MLAIQNLPKGTRIKLAKDDEIVEIVENPGDGTWLIVRRLGAEPGEELCHVDDVLEVVETR